MNHRFVFPHAVVAAFCLWQAPAFAEVTINEIMYHPSSENVLEEYVELYNPAATNVSLAGWRFTSGVQFDFPSNAQIRAQGYLVVCAHRDSFLRKYPAVTNAVGDWVSIRTTNILGRQITNYLGVLSNTKNDLRLENPAGEVVDRVEYADEGDWAIRRRGLSDLSHRGWIWYSEHDGLGKSLELINPNLPHDTGQNWASSLTLHGTPGQLNSAFSNNIPPLIRDVRHFPVVPRTNDTVTVTARVLDELATGLSVSVLYRVDATTPPPFTTLPMFDDGAHADGAAGDSLFGAVLPAQAENTVVEFYVEAQDSGGLVRNWPAPAWPATDQSGPPTNAANALYQVDSRPQNAFGGVPSLQPVYKLIMTETERAELAGIPCSGSQNSDAQMNGTFISLDGTETLVRYLCGFRNRGHGSRCASPPNYRVSFRSDEPWKGVTALNLNSRSVHVQHLGSVLALQSGAVGANTRAVQVRVNGSNLAASGSPMFGSYAANEAVNSDWAEQHFPSDSGGNIYRAVRDISPHQFNYRGPSASAYRNTYYKESNVSEDDWSDLIGMLRIIGTNDLFNSANARQVVNVEQWFLHLAVMNLYGNNETGLNTGYNDDYLMYRAVDDPRFVLMYWDLDTILGQGGSLGTSADIFSATNHTTSDRGAGTAFERFMRWPEFEPIYYRTLQDLLDTTFSAERFNALVDQTLGPYVQSSTISNIKNWMNNRRSYVQSVIASRVPPRPVVATISGEPRSPTPLQTATLTVAGTNVTHYRFRRNSGAYGPETPVATPIQLQSLLHGSTNTVFVIGRDASGLWQSTNAPTVSRTWSVNTKWPTVRLNEILADNVTAVNYLGTHPDLLELYNEGSVTADLGGLRITDDPNQPGRFTFPDGVLLPPGSNLVLYANTEDGNPGWHLGFGFNQDGEGVYLYDRATNGNAVLDSVVFGLQLTDLSIGRFGNSGDWRLCQPTFGAPNIEQPTADPHNLRINEWLAAPQGLLAEDFVELYNRDALPVALGGLYLTAEPIGAPALHRITPLSYLGGNNWRAFFADGDPAQGADHLNFRLASEQGQLALLTPLLAIIDSVAYGPQRPGVSEGRCPDGGAAFRIQPQPTPGFGNQCPVTPPPTQTIPLLAIGSSWRFDDSGANLGTDWRTVAYDDSGWPAGPGLLGVMRPGGTLPEPILTPLAASNVKTTYYFRAHFIFPTNVDFPTIQLRHVIDDGAVFYLNGAEIHRYNLPAGPVLATTLATNDIPDADYRPPVTLAPSNFLPGDNLLAVEVHQSSAASPDTVFGAVIEVVTATNAASLAGLVLNEVLANNTALDDPDGSTPDWIEIYNPSSNVVLLAGTTLGDAAGFRWTFPPGAIMPALGYLTVRMDGSQPPSATNTGFSLKSSGDTLYLFDAAPLTNRILDSITFGLQTADFSIGRIPNGTSNWILTLPTLGAANLAANLGDPRQLKINEWMPSTPAGGDWLEVYNPNSQPVAVGLWYLTDRLDEPTRHRIPALSFIGAITNAWQKFVADGDTGAGADHVAFHLGFPTEAVGIADPAGFLVDGVDYTVSQPGLAQGRLPDGSTNIVDFPGSESPGEANFLRLTNIVISEVLTHTDLPLEDAIELQNLGATPLDLTGWWLSDARGTLRKFQLTSGTVIPPGGFTVLYEYQFNNPDRAAIPFSLSSAKGDQVYLSAATTNGSLVGRRASVDFGPAANGVSFGRYRTSIGEDFVATTRRTFGVDNPLTVEQFRQGAGLSNAPPLVGPVVFTEIMYHPPDVISAGQTNDNVLAEFVELRNITTNLVPLFDPAHPTNGWKLRDAVDFNFNQTHSLPPGGSLLVVSFDPVTNLTALTQFQAVYGSNSLLVGPYQGKLDNSNERIALSRPDAPQPAGPDAGLVPYILVEQVSYTDRSPWPVSADGFGHSLQRISSTLYGNEPTNWFAAAPAPDPAGNPDRDNDGLPDAWELANDLDPADPADATTDPDGDHLNNRQEYLSGTDPQSGVSYLKLDTVTVAGSQAQIRFHAAAGKSYSVLYSSAPTAGVWHKLTDVPPSATPVERLVVDLDTGQIPQRHYRLTTPALP